MANAIKAAESILGMEISGSMARQPGEEDLRKERGILAEPGQKEADRCLKFCSTVCENCVDVSPSKPGKYIHSRAEVWTKRQVIHVDYMCNECGNCKEFLSI